MKLKLYINQYNEKFIASSLKELKQKHYISGKVSKMYVDTKSGKTMHTGYVIGKQWFDVFELTPLRKEATL